LPRRWANERGIKKGDELNVEEAGNKLIVSTEKEASLEKIDLDISNLDRSSIMHIIRAAYRKGYDEISLKFDNDTVPHFRLHKNINVISVVHTEVNRLVGVEIIKQTENFCLIKSITPGAIKEFDILLRRIFSLLKDAHKDMVTALKEYDKTLLETIEEKHDSISKFSSYCLRLLNRYGYGDSKQTSILYHIIASLDKIADIIKYAGRLGLVYGKPMSKKAGTVLDAINFSIESYIECFYKFDTKKVVDFMRNRDEAARMIEDFSKKIPAEENTIINRMENNLEILLDLMESKMSLN